MDVLLVVVLLQYQLLTPPLLLVELLLHAVQRQMVELTAQRKRSSFYRRSLFSLSLSFCSFLIGFFVGLCVVLLVDAQVGVYCAGRILPFECPRVIDVLFYEEADARSAVDFSYICVAMVVYLSHEFVLM